VAEQHTIHQAKTHLSKLVARAEAGEEIVLARGDKPVAKLVPFEAPAKGVRELGWLKGQVWLDPGFDDPLPDDELALWNGEGD